MQYGLTRTYRAQGAIGGRRLVKWGTADNTVTLCTAATDLSIGVSAPNVDAVDLGSVDVILGGIAEVIAGGNITRGQEVTSDGAGAGVACTPAAGTAKRSIGQSQVSAVANDFFEVLVRQGQITTPV
jgi:hypothetical protein